MGIGNVFVIDEVDSVVVWLGVESRQGRCGFIIFVYFLVIEV